MSELPGGWCTTLLGNVIEVKTGKLDANAAVENGKYPFFTCANVASKINTYEFDTEAILLAGNGGFSVKHYSGRFNAYQRTYVIESEILNTKYLYWLIKHNKSDITSSERGSTIPYIRKGDITSIQVKIPPLNEQIRIANKLDTMLAKVDAAQARLDKIPNILKRFRQSVLAAATSGELTKDWRGTEELSNWQEKKLLDVITSKPRNGTSPKGVAYVTPIRNLTLSAITSGFFKPDKFKYVDLDVALDSYLWIKNGDLLIQRANSLEYVGVSALYTGEDNQFIYPDLIMKCRANEEIIREYLFYSVSCERVREYFRDNATGTAGNMPKINQGVVSNAPISLPPIVEQKEVVRRVESLFNMADTIEKQYNEAKARTNRLTQSILAKAFRGELVPQDPNDAPASELLARIISNKENKPPAKPKRKSVTKKTKSISNNIKTGIAADDESVKKWIKNLDMNTFSIEDINNVFSADYEQLKNVLFSLLQENEPMFKKVFDAEKKDFVFKKV